MLQEFAQFLKQYGVVGLALAVIIGGKLNALVSAVVDGLIMPVVTAFVPGGAWRTTTLDVGPVHLLPGPVFGALIDFVLVCLVVFYLSKHLLGEPTVNRK